MHSHLNGIVLSSKTFLELQRGQQTPFGQRRATKYLLHASSSGNSFSNCGTVICWVNFAHIAVLSMSEKHSIPKRFARQVPDNRLQTRETRKSFARDRFWSLSRARD